MSQRNQRHGRGRRAAAKWVRRALLRLAMNYAEQTRQSDFRLVGPGVSRFVHVRPDGTVVVTETATAPDCRIEFRAVAPGGPA